MDTVSWLFNFIPWWAFVIVALVLIGFLWQFIMPIWLALPNSVKKVIVGIAALFLVYVAGRNRGSKDERDQQDKRDAKANDISRKVEDDVKKLPDDQLDSDLAKWMRKRR